MGGRGSKSASSRITPATATVSAGGARNYAALTDEEASDIIAEQNSLYNIDTRLAIKQYISPSDTGNGYSMSQNLNYALENGRPLNANEQYMDTRMSAAMHDLGTDTMLYRGAHQDVLSTLGVQNYQGMSAAQLNQSLTGAVFSSKSYTSASYDLSRNPFLTGAQAGGREVVMRIKAGSSTKVIFGAKAQAEVILAKGTQYRVTGARFTGQTVYPRTGGAYKQVELDIEVEG